LKSAFLVIISIGLSLVAANVEASARWLQPEFRTSVFKGMNRITFTGFNPDAQLVRVDYRKSVIVQLATPVAGVEPPIALREYIRSVDRKLAGKLARAKANWAPEIKPDAAGKFDLNLYLPEGLTQVAIEIVTAQTVHPVVVLFQVKGNEIEVNAPLSRRDELQAPLTAEELKRPATPGQVLGERSSASLWRLRLGLTGYNLSFKQTSSVSATAQLSTSDVPTLDAAAVWTRGDLGVGAWLFGGSQEASGDLSVVGLQGRSYEWSDRGLFVDYRLNFATSAATRARVSLRQKNLPLVGGEIASLTLNRIEFLHLGLGGSWHKAWSPRWSRMFSAQLWMPAGGKSDIAGALSVARGVEYDLRAHLIQRLRWDWELDYALGVRGQSSSYDLRPPSGASRSGDLTYRDIQLGLGATYSFN
jgi:hypothetical protein